MAFTQDELQALNAIMEQKLSTQRRELERAFDLRMQALRREFEQRLTTVQHDLLHTMSRRLNDQHLKTHEVFQRKLEQQQVYLSEQFERSLAAQLLAIEQIIHQRLTVPTQPHDFSISYTADGQPEYDTIEVQTEIPWEELADLVDRALEERLGSVQETLLTVLTTIQQTLTSQRSSGATATASADTQNIERLEQLLEAMQVSMVSNCALITNRLYHHQQLPLERAHPSQRISSTPPRTQPLPPPFPFVPNTDPNDPTTSPPISSDPPA